MKGKPILCLDFDGVVHSYPNGWRDGSIYADATDGFFEWAAEAALQFDLVIHSSRATTTAGANAIVDWLVNQAEKAGFPGAAGLFEVSAVKPPAFLSIDDRCIRFDGDWSDPKLAPIAIRAFQPWTARKEEIIP